MVCGKGEILSPHLFFNVGTPINELSSKLNKPQFIGSISTGYGTIILSTLMTLLFNTFTETWQVLIDMYVAFGVDNDIIYNEEKKVHVNHRSRKSYM